MFDAVSYEKHEHKLLRGFGWSLLGVLCVEIGYTSHQYDWYKKLDIR